MSDSIDTILKFAAEKAVARPAGHVGTAGEIVKGEAGDRSQTKALNNRVALVVVLIVAVAAIPYGSNRPFFWTLWATVLSGMMLYYQANLRHGGLTARRPLSLLPTTTALYLLVGSWMLIQCLPIGAFLGPFEFVTQTNSLFQTQTISIAPGDTLLAFLKWATYGLLFYLCLQAGARKGRARYILFALMVLVTAEALYSFAALLYLDDALLLTGKQQYQGDATGTFVNRNSFATFLAMGACLAAAFAVPRLKKSENRRRRRGEPRMQGLEFSSQNMVGFACLVIIGVALVATNSRMGVFAGLCGILVAVLLKLPTNRIRAVSLVLLIGGGAVVLAFYGGELFNRLLLTERSAGYRLDLYRQIATMIADRPILGFGADSFQSAYPLYQAPPVASDLVFDKAHSTYLAQWVELGVLFGIMPILLAGSIAWTLIRYIIKSGNRSTEVCAALGVLTTAAVHSLVDFSLEIQAVVFLFIAVIALGLSEALALEKDS